MDDLTQINTFSRNEVYRLYREAGRSPHLAKHEEAEESIIKSEYSPHTAFANALRRHWKTQPTCAKIGL